MNHLKIASWKPDGKGMFGGDQQLNDFIIICAGEVCFGDVVIN